MGHNIYLSHLENPQSHQGQLRVHCLLSIIFVQAPHHKMVPTAIAIITALLIQGPCARPTLTQVPALRQPVKPGVRATFAQQCRPCIGFLQRHVLARKINGAARLRQSAQTLSSIPCAVPGARFAIHLWSAAIPHVRANHYIHQRRPRSIVPLSPVNPPTRQRSPSPAVARTERSYTFISFFLRE